MPPRSPWMKRRILGFQRRVWWPKCTPASSSSLIPTSGMLCAPLVDCDRCPRRLRRTRSTIARAGPPAVLPRGRKNRTPRLYARDSLLLR